MNLIKELEEKEYTTKEMIAYFLVAFCKSENTNNIALLEYIKEVKKLLKTDSGADVLEKVDTKLIENFPINYIVNYNELICFALVVFYMLLESNKKIMKRDIINQLYIEMTLFSTRTIKKEAQKILRKIKKSSMRIEE